MQPTRCLTTELWFSVKIIKSLLRIWLQDSKLQLNYHRSLILDVILSHLCLRVWRFYGDKLKKKISRAESHQAVHVNQRFRDRPTFRHHACDMCFSQIYHDISTPRLWGLSQSLQTLAFSNRPYASVSPTTFHCNSTYFLPRDLFY